MSLKFSLKCSQGLWRRHFWWQTVPGFCCSDRERSVADRGQTCYGVLTRSSKCPANFQQMYSKYTC